MTVDRIGKECTIGIDTMLDTVGGTFFFNVAFRHFPGYGIEIEEMNWGKHGRSGMNEIEITHGEKKISGENVGKKAHSQQLYGLVPP